MLPENDETLSDEEVFNEAKAPETSPEEPTVEDKPATVAEPKEEVEGAKSRDEKGRFAPTKGNEEDKSEHHIPSWRLREEAESRREAERRASQLEQMLAQYEQRIQQLQPQPQVEFPDFFQHPEALPQYFEHVLQEREAKWQADFKQAVANMSLQRAHDRYGKDFQEAFEHITSMPLTHPLRQQVINSPDPGETLVKLYKDQRNLSTIGEEGVDAFVQKRLEAALEDPEFLAKAIERAQQVALTQPTQRIKVPTSLNNATGARMSRGDDELTDADIFRISKG